MLPCPLGILALRLCRSVTAPKAHFLLNAYRNLKIDLLAPLSVSNSVTGQYAPIGKIFRGVVKPKDEDEGRNPAVRNTSGTTGRSGAVAAPVICHKRVVCSAGGASAGRGFLYDVRWS